MAGSDLQALMPKLALAFTLMLAKDVLISGNGYGSVRAVDPVENVVPETMQAPKQPNLETSQDSFTDFAEEDDDDEYVAPTQKHSVYSKQVHVRFSICTS